MSWLQGILGIALLAGAIFGWVALQRKFRGDDTPLLSAARRRGRNAETENELEAFVAAYREGKVDPTMLTSDEEILQAAPETPRRGPTLSPAAAIGAVSTGATAAPAASHVAAPPPPGTLLRPEVKLAYLTFRSGLRDHHVFANVRLGDLGYGTAVGTVDLLVCDPAFKYVAAIDVYSGEQPDDVPKSMFLRRAGVRHIYLSTRAMPKPAQLHDLVYGKPPA